MQAWDRFLTELEALLGKETVERWLRSLQIARFDAANLYLQARDALQANWFEEHVRPHLTRFVNNNQRPIRVHLSLPSSKRTIEKAPPPFSIVPDSLDPEMALEHFVICPENEMACRILSQGQFNPIFLYGPAGSGKTHLLTGIALAWQKKGKKILFVRAETFTGHLVQAIRLGQMREFRRAYREMDALFLDDVHLFSRKNATQEEFFHTFNTLHTAGKRIFLTSSLPPSQLIEIEPRLISRFEWGISAAICRGSSREILQRKSALWGFSLSEELLVFLLESFPRAPWVALQALALRTKGKEGISPLLAEKLLADLFEKERKEALTPEKIIKKVADHYAIQREELLGNSQTKECAGPRKVAMYLCRKKLKLSYQKIGEIFNRDHSTVIANVRQIERGIEEKQRDLLDAIRDC